MCGGVRGAGDRRRTVSLQLLRGFSPKRPPWSRVPNRTNRANGVRSYPSWIRRPDVCKNKGTPEGGELGSVAAWDSMRDPLSPAPPPPGPSRWTLPATVGTLFITNIYRNRQAIIEKTVEGRSSLHILLSNIRHEPLHIPDLLE